MPTNANVPNRDGYAGRVVTQPPEWHTLVVFDVLCNNLASGLFLVAAVGEFTAPATFAAVVGWAYPIALVFVLIDLALLVLDLGDPLRFHHMLRVFKPSSPMSLGTWCLAFFSLFLTAIVAIELVIASGWLDSAAGWWARTVAVIGALPFAFGSAAYKGVLFSTTAQPGWKDARWLGGYLVNSAILLGSGELLAFSILMGQEAAVGILRPTLALLLLTNVVALGLLLIDVRETLSAVYTRSDLGRLGVLVVGGGALLPLGLLFIGGPLAVLGAVLFIVLGALAVRLEVVRLPHRFAHPHAAPPGR